MICFICWVIDDDEGRKRGGRLSRNLGATTSAATLINLFAIWYKEMLTSGTTTFASESGKSESAWTARCHACTRSAEIFHNNVAHVRCLQHDNILIYTCDESVKNFTAHDAAAFDFWVCETLEKASEETFAASHVLLIHKITVEGKFSLLHFFGQAEAWERSSGHVMLCFVTATFYHSLNLTPLA